jgi:hypothetical protein
MTSSIRLALTLLLFLCLGAGVTPVLADGGNPYPPICGGGPCPAMK